MTAPATIPATTEPTGVDEEKVWADDQAVAAVEHSFAALIELTEAQRTSLPARFHAPVFDGLATPHSWVCMVCWGDGWATSWPCTPATEGGLELARHIGLRHHW